MIQLSPGHLFRETGGGQGVVRETGGGQGVLRETGGGQGVQLSPGHLWRKNTHSLEALQGAALHSLPHLQGKANPISRAEFPPQPLLLLALRLWCCDMCHRPCDQGVMENPDYLALWSLSNFPFERALSRPNVHRQQTSRDRKTLPRVHLISCQGVKLFLPMFCQKLSCLNLCFWILW